MENFLTPKILKFDMQQLPVLVINNDSSMMMETKKAQVKIFFEMFF
jgi:hypothetical protein